MSALVSFISILTVTVGLSEGSLPPLRSASGCYCNMGIILGVKILA
jgi:hypothetical protein